MFWDVLGIKETKDVKEITKAYRQKLVHTNPEDKPEEFKALRQAYEQAMDFARNNNVPISPIDEWKNKLEALYNDFERRIQLKEWKQLLNEDVSLSLDKKLMIEEALLKFFMEKYRIPHVVWVYLNEQFNFLDHVEELYDNYPKEFIDYVIVNGINYMDVLPYDLFTPGKDGQAVEQYINLYLNARNEAYENAKPIVEEMLALPESHPYGIILKTMFELENGVTDSIQPLIDLYEKYPEEDYCMYSLANAYNKVGEYEKCEELCRKLLEKESINRVKWLLANALGNQKRYKEGIEIIHDLMNASGGDQMMVYELNEKRKEWNKFLIEQYKKELEENYDNHQNRVDLTWAYLQNDFLDESYELSKTLEKEQMEPFDFYNLMSNIYISKNEFEQAIPMIDGLLEVLENMEDDGSEKTKKRLRRYPEMLNRKGFCLLALKRDEEGLEIYDRALKISNDDSEILTRVTQIAISRKEYAKAEDYAHRLIKVNPQGYHGYLLLAFILFYEHYDRGAFEAVNQSLEIYGGDLEAYILKIRIMIRNGAYEGAHEIMDFLESNGLSQDIQVLFCKGLFKEIEENKLDEAVEYYEQVQAKIEQPHIYNFAAELYYRILWIKGTKLNANKKEDWKIMYDLANKGIEEDESHYGLIDYKAWLLVRHEKYKEALKLYKQLEQNPNHSPDVETQIGYIYYQSLEKDAKLALEYYLKSIELEDTGNKRFYAGMCYLYLGQLEESEKQFLTLQKMNPEGLDSYFRLSAVYEAMNEYEKALNSINKALEIVSKREGDQTRYYKCKVRILRRMKRVEEAVETVNYMVKTYNYAYGHKDIVSIYCQYGMWEEAKKEMERWKISNVSYDPESEIRMYIQLHDYKKAQYVYDEYKDQMPKGQSLSLKKTMCQMNLDLYGELETLLEIEEYYKSFKGSDLSHTYMTMALCYKRLKDHDKQIEYAKKALRIVNRKLKAITQDHTLYYGRKVKILSLLNKDKEARECLAIAKSRPLCDFCAYSSCKDADIYEVTMEEAFGNKEKALQMALAYVDKWPDEDDFTLAYEYLKKEEA